MYAEHKQVVLGRAAGHVKQFVWIVDVGTMSTYVHLIRGVQQQGPAVWASQTLSLVFLGGGDDLGYIFCTLALNSGKKRRRAPWET